MDPQYAVAWIYKGNALYNQHKYDEAIQAYDKAIEIDPDTCTAWNNKGIAFDDVGKYDEATQAYDKAIKMDLNVQ